MLVKLSSEDGFPVCPLLEETEAGRIEEPSNWPSSFEGHEPKARALILWLPTEILFNKETLVEDGDREASCSASRILSPQPVLTPGC